MHKSKSAKKEVSSAARKGSGPTIVRESLPYKAKVTSHSPSRKNVPVTQERPPPPPKSSLFPKVSSTSASPSAAVITKQPSTKVAFPPSLAAAMLSFPWPPPEKPMLALALQRDQDARALKQSQDNGGTSPKASAAQVTTTSSTSTQNGNESKTKVASQPSCCCGPKNQAHSKPCCAVKVYPKKKSAGLVPLRQYAPPSKSVVITGDNRARKPGQPYLPVTTPPFHHVHTAWPGFDHAPVPNWKRKYMIAKPWPVAQRKGNIINRHPHSHFGPAAGAVAHLGPDLLLSRPSAHMDLLNGNLFTGRSLASADSQSSSQTQLVAHHPLQLAPLPPVVKIPRENEAFRSTAECAPQQAMQRKPVRLQRVGSCMR